MKHLKKAVGAGALTLALAVTGCSAGGGGNAAKPTVDQSKGASDTATLPTTAWTATDYSAVKEGGQLTLAVDQLPDNWNMLQADGANAAAGDIIDPTSGGPVKIKADGTWEPNPDYATEVKLASEDPQVVEIKLNPKAVWQDGTPMTYKDFEATFKAMSGANKDFQNVTDSVYKDIESVTKTDSDQNFKITFKNKSADWPSILGGEGSIMPAAIAADPKAFNEGYKSKALPSNGPYMVSNVDQTGKVVTLTPNPKWWGEKPKLEKILMKVVSRDQLAQAYSNKEIDAVVIGTNKDNYDTAKKRTDGTIQQSGGVTWSHITLNGSKGPLADVKVRQAVATAINREVMAESRLKPIGAPVTNQNNFVFMPGQKGYEDNVNATMGFDLKKSNSLMEEAGYKKGGDGMYAKDGAPIKLVYTIDANNPVSEQSFKQVQANLKAAGIKVDNSTVPADKFFSDYVLKSNFEMVSFAWQGTPFPISSGESIFYPKDAGQNYTGLTDDKLGDLWKKANAELDPEKRLAIANEISKTIAAYVPVIPLTPSPITMGVKTGLVNYGSAQFETVDWTKVGWKS